ncbi:MAG: hypothetical protein II767_13310 [Proteobacteria bacterium]|nr:hypothetical protein [Pseudomonadota bacterium]
MAADRIAMIKATLKYTSQDDLIEAMRPLISTRGLFIRTRTTRPVGSEVRFEFKLADGSVTYAGEGIVRKEIPFVGGPSSQGSGMLIALRKINRPFKEVVDVVIGAQQKSDRDVTPSAMPAVKVPEAKDVEADSPSRMIVDAKRANDGLDLFGELDMDEGLDFLFSGIGKKEGVKPVEESEGFTRLKVVSGSSGKPTSNSFEEMNEIEFGDIEAEDFDVDAALNAVDAFTDLPRVDADMPDVAQDTIKPIRDDESTLPPVGARGQSEINALFAAVEQEVDALGLGAPVSHKEPEPEAPEEKATQNDAAKSELEAVQGISLFENASEPEAGSASEPEGASEADVKAEAADGASDADVKAEEADVASDAEVKAEEAEAASDADVKAEAAEAASEADVKAEAAEATREADAASISDVISEENLSQTAGDAYGGETLAAEENPLLVGSSSELNAVISGMPEPRLGGEQPIFEQPSHTLVGMPNQGDSEDFLSKPALDPDFLSKPPLSPDFLSKPVEISAEIPKADVSEAADEVPKAEVTEVKVDESEKAAQEEVKQKGPADSFFSEMLANSSDTLSKVVEAESPSEVFEALRGDFLEQNACVNDGHAQTVAEAIAETTESHPEREVIRPEKALFSELNGTQHSTSTSDSLIDNLVNGTPEKKSDEIKPATISEISQRIASQSSGELPHVQSRLSKIPVSERKEEEGISLNSLSNAREDKGAPEVVAKEKSEEDGLSLDDLMKQQERVNVGSKINDSFSHGINLAAMPRKERKTFDTPSSEAEIPSRKKGLFGRIFGK